MKETMNPLYAVVAAALGVLSSMLGFGEQEQALMIALYITMDNFGTACNVTGDGAIAMVIDKFFRKKAPEMRSEAC